MAGTDSATRPPAPQEKREVLYCVTGATGYLASWLVRRLLERGYRVRGTIRNRAKAGHLTCLPGAEERLELVEADLLDEASLGPAVQGCDGVFAVAIPLLDPSKDQSAMIELALTCTLNLLRACHDSGSVKRVVLTSTFYAATKVPHDSNVPLDMDETCWTSVEYCSEKKMSCWGYMVAKTMSEKVAFQFAKEKGLDVVSILPSLVGGAFTTPSLPGSVAVYLASMTDGPEWMHPLLEYMSYVHVDDCIRAHILLMEDVRAEGRYLCSACDATLGDVLHETIPLLESFKLPQPKLDVPANDYVKPYKLNTTKLNSLGFTYQFDTLHKIFKDTVVCLLEKGYLQQVQQ